MPGPYKNLKDHSYGLIHTKYARNVKDTLDGFSCSTLLIIPAGRVLAECVLGVQSS